MEPGHQFEWAWLLERWGRLRNEEDAKKAARTMFRLAVRDGVDRKRGVAINALLDDLAVHDPAARLWPQTERIKAAAILVEAESDLDQRSSLLTELSDGIRGLELYLDTPTPGLWRDRMTESGAFVEEAAPASSFYHIVCAIAELTRYIEGGLGQ